eukprot:NODE_267_length_11298_cov_1.167872.p6 type:complete len:266 gc:universal NODE_267_length_11298_cov_1.167872:3291-2494(-)
MISLCHCLKLIMTSLTKRRISTSSSDDMEPLRKKVIVSESEESEIAEVIDTESDSTMSEVRISDNELNDLIDIPETPKSKLVISSDEESDPDINFIDNSETRRVLLPLDYRSVSNQEWFVLFCQYLCTNDDSNEDLVSAKNRFEYKVKHLKEQLKSQRWTPKLSKEVEKTKKFKSFEIDSVDGCDICGLKNRTSRFEVQLDDNTYFSGRFCLERLQHFRSASKLIANLKKKLVSMEHEYLESLFDDFQNEVDRIETYIQKGMSED